MLCYAMEVIKMKKESSSSVKGGGGGGDGFIDRSKVRILLCDNDSKSSQHISSLLFNCSYQVRSAREVMDALNADGPDIDIILAELNLPMPKGIKMLKYITRHAKFTRIPVIMMSAQDEVSIVVNCLRSGAADYLVKPLRTNELFNLWTHMWRRRRMLGLAEKNMTYEFNLVPSDPSDASTTLFSDDTDNLENGIILSNHYHYHYQATASPPFSHLPDSPRTMATDHSQTEQLFSGLKKSELKIGESSAFFTYVKSNTTLKKNSQGFAKVDDKATQPMELEDNNNNNKVQAPCQLVVNEVHANENGETWELNYSQSDHDLPASSGSIPNSFSMEISSTPPMSSEYPQQMNFISRSGNESHCDESIYQYYQVMMQSSPPFYPHGHGIQNPSMPLPAQYNIVGGMTSTIFPYYPYGMCLQQAGNNNRSWPPTFSAPAASSPNDAKINTREAALMKFRQKRKERCFDKKIRYVNRKHLAERRPRVRGQFVRKVVNGINVDLNGHPANDEDLEEENVSTPGDDT